MLLIEEIDYFFHGKFKSQTNIQELQSRNMKIMLVAFLLNSFQELSLWIFLENRKGNSSTLQEDVLYKKFTLSNTANSVMCKYNFFNFFTLF